MAKLHPRNVRPLGHREKEEEEEEEEANSMQQERYQASPNITKSKDRKLSVKL